MVPKPSAFMRQGRSRSAFHKAPSTGLPGSPMVIHCASSAAGTSKAQASRNLSVSLAILLTGAGQAQDKLIFQPGLPSAASTDNSAWPTVGVVRSSYALAI
jgi:hypothetical protein